MKSFLVFLSIFFIILVTILIGPIGKASYFKQNAIAFLKNDILKDAAINLKKEPETITSFICSKSKGGIHDFYSEGDYWWPDDNNPGGPYVRKDGLSNPNNFTKHREVLIRFSKITGNLTSAYLITGNKKYAKAVIPHLRAWFICDTTKMNPDLQFAQAIHGRVQGRSIGIIDGIHLMEVAQSIIILHNDSLITPEDFSKIKLWFSKFTTWLTTSPFGLKEMKHPNNHSVWWNAQVASYARLTQNTQVIRLCTRNFKHLMNDQMSEIGSFPNELKRTKPYSYSLFVLDGMVMNCILLSQPDSSMWQYKIPAGQTIKKAIDFMAPFIENKEKWKYPHDVAYWNLWPVDQSSLLFAAIHYHNDQYFKLWKTHYRTLKNKEIIRNQPIRNPIIWFDYLN